MVRPLGSTEADDVTLSLAQLVQALVDVRAGDRRTERDACGGAVDIVAGVVLRVRGGETGNLVGTDTEDVVTLSGRQLDAILIGPGGIDLGDGADPGRQDWRRGREGDGHRTGDAGHRRLFRH
jgi:hypothetical protein